MKVENYDFNHSNSYGIAIFAGGFETRALSFIDRLKKDKIKIEKVILLRYITKLEDNNKNFNLLYKKIEKITDDIITIDINIDLPDKYIDLLTEKTKSISNYIKNNSLLIDISGMAHILICACLHAAKISQLKTSIVYTEAEDYFPRKQSWKKVIDAVQKREYQIIANYLQTAGLKDIQIPTSFKGNIRPRYKLCLFVMVGYEPNRVKGLIDDYAPNAIIAFYGKSPHSKFYGRQQLSRELHKNVFDGWRYREISDVSTLNIDDITKMLEKEYKKIRGEYDVAILSQCSKMQTVATYLFWQNHPEIQLVFTTAVKIDTKRYSRGEGNTFLFDI